MTSEREGKLLSGLRCIRQKKAIIGGSHSDEKNRKHLPGPHSCTVTSSSLIVQT